MGDEANKFLQTNLSSIKSSMKDSVMPDKYVLLAANIDEKFQAYYFFYLPFITMAWSRLGFQPIVLLVTTKDGDLNNFNNQNGPAMATVKYLIDLGATLKLVKSDEGYDLMTSLICRMFVGALDFLGEEDYVITSDSDLIPIMPEYYETEDTDGITAWNSECCGRFTYKNRSYQMYPMGHIGMKKKHWKGVMNLASDTEINSKAIAGLISDFFSQKYVKKNNKIAKGDPTWIADQTILSQKIEVYTSDLNKAKLIKKPFEGMRLDRSQNDDTLNYLMDYKFDKLTDFHAFQSNYLNKWNIISKLLEKLFTRDTYKILYSYFSEFKQAINSQN
ncbi:hypothetical protein BpHYR1_032652 [Brachionus plicatilis]|uniref:Uncharacterized protein n=1 Tax=Brachionus plicatilis TaxID=10195 RepID=A0A3M7RDH4_BRAPC|nr:hypothetical protein BpHYR1_032652 [Brachionus plicatilis]